MCEKYEEFFREYLEFREELLDALKKSGKNEYNPYLAVESEHKEKLHSNVLFSFLNPLSKHYQDDLFLKCFLNVVGLEEWFGDTKNAEVKREKTLSGGSRIDLYVSNGKRCIILENKIWAKDGEEQIQRYIEGIDKDYNREHDSICVIYLSLEGTKPSKESLGRWDIDESGGALILRGENRRVKFEQLSYKKHILEWLDKAQQKLKNITNLNQALEAYRDVVKIVTNQGENKMSIVEFLKGKNYDENEIAIEIIKNQGQIIPNYLKKICEELQGFQGWECNTELTCYDNEDHKCIFLPKEDYRGKCFFAFVWTGYDNESSENSFGVRLCGERPEEKRKCVAEKLSGTRYKLTHNSWSCVEGRVRLKELTGGIREEIKRFIERWHEHVLEVNKYLSQCDNNQ